MTRLKLVVDNSRDWDRTVLARECPTCGVGVGRFCRMRPIRDWASMRIKPNQRCFHLTRTSAAAREWR